MIAARPSCAAVAAAIAAACAPGAGATGLKVDRDFATAREALDPVRWVIAQASPGPQPPPPTTDAAAAGPSWAAVLFPFAGTGEPVGFAPARWGGTIAAEYLDQRTESASRQLLVGALTLNAASYFWKPWFAQVQGNLTALFTGERGDALDPANRTGFVPAASLSGGGTLTVFPASRFPFLASFQTTDSRASGEYAASDYRNTRLTLRQSWRDPLGTSTAIGSFDYSAISSSAFGRDTVAQLDGRYLLTTDPHRLDAVLNFSRNRQDGGAGSDIVRAYSSHLYTPTPDLWVSSIASLSESDFSSGGSATRFTQRLGQVSSQAVWRPEWDERLAVTGGGRAFLTQFARDGSSATAHSVGANAGASYALTQETTLNASLATTRIDTENAGPDILAFGSAGATYTSRPWSLGFADWSLSASLQASHQSGGPESSRSAASAQADQQLARTYELGRAASLNVVLTQGGGVVEDSFTGRTDTLRAGASAGLRIATTEASEAYLGASYSGSDSRGGIEDRFRLANIQASGQLRLGAHDSLSANLTAQWVRSNLSLLASQGESRQLTGGIGYQHARLFGVPRLRYQLSATFNEGVFTSSRLLGDVDAPRENITQLVDSRLLYDIGRLEIRVGTRLAKVDGRDDLQWYLRIYRHIGQY